MERAPEKLELRNFLNKKTVILPENSTVEEAAKAMANQKVGCVVVKARHKITGIVTDRDLACYVLAEQRSPQTALGDVVLVEELACVTEDSTVQEVIDRMIQHGVRRIPVVKTISHDRETCVGIVTMDDLVVAGAIDMTAAREVIKPQVRLVDRHASSKFQKRKEARLEQSYNIFIKTLAREMAMDRNDAEPVIFFLLKSLVERISYTEASDFISALPKLIQDDLYSAPSGPNRNINKEFILQQMQNRFNLDRLVSERIARGFWTGLEFYLLNNECNHIMSQLPIELQLLLRP